MINSKTRLMGLIGFPVSHSFSPTLHNTVMEKRNFNGAYLAYPVEKHRVKEAILGFHALNFLGCNVTVPHKTACMPYLDEISTTAKTIGAVNTIINRDGKLIGDNTDAYGFQKMLENFTDTKVLKKACILGAGGSAKSVIVSLASMGVEEIIVLARNIEKCEVFVDEYKEKLGNISIVADELVNFKNLEDSIDLLVNCTPVGMHPNVDNTPVAFNKPKKTMIVVDLIYNPAVTRLMADGIEKGLQALNGIEMLIYQAAKSYELWTGDKCEDLYVQVAKEHLL